jgi:hypothetical protein
VKGRLFIILILLTAALVTLTVTAYGTSLDNTFYSEGPAEAAAEQSASSAAPIITSITPSTGINTGTVHINALTGNHFQLYTRVMLTKTNQLSITAANIWVNATMTRTQIQCDLDLTGAMTGTWNVVVTNPDSQTASLLDGFTVIPPAPMVSGITPSASANTGTVHITNLAGNYFQPGAIAYLTKSDQTPITATNTNVMSATKITCDFDVAGAAIGTWNVMVINPDTQSGMLTNGFEVRSSTQYVYLPVILKPVPPPPNYALQFSGDDFVNIPDNGSTFYFPNGFTVEAWLKPTTPASTSKAAGIIRRSQINDPTNMFWSNPGSWTMFLEEGDYSKWGLIISLGFVSNNAKSPSNNLKANQWQHVAGTFDKSQIVIYRNGQPVAAQNQTGTMTNSPAQRAVLIGAWRNYFTGLIDEVRIWNIARSQADIQTAMSKSLSGNETGLFAYWRFDEGRGQDVLDSTSNANTGRLGNSAVSDTYDPAWVLSDVPIQ